MVIKPYQRHLLVAAAGTGALYIAITYLPIWAVLLIAFAILYAIDNNNNLTKGV